MISEFLKMVDNLPGESFFYLENGPLKHKLLACYREEEDAHGEILEFEHNVSLRVSKGGCPGAPQFDCRLEAGDFQYRAVWSSGDFTVDERVELVEYLKPHCIFSPSKGSGSGNNIVRKKPGDGLLNISAVSSSLGLSQRALKTLIPCNEMRIVEEGGDKTIKEYFWDKQLVGRLERLAVRQSGGRGYNKEDLDFVAACCCEGDRKWARDVIRGFLNQRQLTDSSREESLLDPTFFS